MYNQYDLNSTSLVKTGILSEMYIPLWYYSSGSFSISSSSSGILAQKGSTSGGSYTSSGAKLHTLNPNWSNNQKFALEASIWMNNSSYTGYAQLWDITANSAVSGSTVSTTATSATLLRSSQFTLTPGHVYGVATWDSGGANGTISLTKASLIAFLS